MIRFIAKFFFLFTLSNHVFSLENEVKLEESPHLLSLPNEIINRIIYSLETPHQAFTLQSSCKPLYNHEPLALITQFAKNLRALKNFIYAPAPFFKEDQHTHLSKKLEGFLKTQEQCYKVRNKWKFYEATETDQPITSITNSLKNEFFDLEIDLQNEITPLYKQVEFFFNHSLFLSQKERMLTFRITKELRMPHIGETQSFYQRLVHTIFRNKKVLKYTTLTLCTLGLMGMTIFWYIPPFISQDFINTYDTSLTGRDYKDFLYEGYNLAPEIIQPNTCLSKDSKVFWSRHTSCLNATTFAPSYYYVGLEQDSFTTVCNKTLMDTINLLKERCGLNASLWQSIIASFNQPTFNTLPAVGRYCNFHPSHNNLVCAKISGNINQVIIHDMAEISLTAAEKAYHSMYTYQAKVCSTFMVVITALLWSCAGINYYFA